MKKPALPHHSASGFTKAVKETLEIITGRRGKKIDPLPETAGTADIIAKINEIADLLQE